VVRLVIWVGPVNARLEEFGFKFEVEIDLRFEGEELWVEGELIHRFERSYSLHHDIVEAFQRSGWPQSMTAPLREFVGNERFTNFVKRPKSDRKLRQKISDSLKRLNKCCKGKLRFMRRGATITWEVSPQVKKKVLMGVA
jgi:hypothetical protein